MRDLSIIPKNTYLGDRKTGPEKAYLGREFPFSVLKNGASSAKMGVNADVS